MAVLPAREWNLSHKKKRKVDATRRATTPSQIYLEEPSLMWWEARSKRGKK